MYMVHMGLQFTASPKRFLTRVTFERPFSCVYTQMPRQIMIERKQFPTELAREGRAHRLVLLHMSREVGLHTERLVTVVALEPLLTSVDPHVAF